MLVSNLRLGKSSSIPRVFVCDGKLASDGKNFERLSKILCKILKKKIINSCLTLNLTFLIVIFYNRIKKNNSKFHYEIIM